MKTNLSHNHRCIPAALNYLPILLGLTAFPVYAADITGDTVTSDLTVEGSSIIIDDGIDHFEFRLGTDRIDFWHDNPGQWVWSHGTTPSDVMSLDASNILSLYDLGAASANPSIILNPGNPDATPAIPASINVGGNEVLTVANSPSLLAGEFVVRNSNNAGSGDSFLMEGTFGGTGVIPTEGAGTRMMWYPEKAAFRVGRVTGTVWDDVLIGADSIGMGKDAHAQGISSIALGEHSFSEKNHSVAIGRQAGARGLDAVAVGRSASAGGSESTALGSYSSAYGDQSLALGLLSYTRFDAVQSIALSGGTVTGSYAIAGLYATASGDLTVALNCAEAQGDSSIAIGGYDSSVGNFPGNLSIGENSTSLGGVGNVTHGFSSFASGFWTKAAVGYSVAMGSLNLGQGSPGDAWVETESLFELGNGNSTRSSEEPPASTRSNAITVLKNGQTTLTNKAWKADPGVAPSSENSHAEALVVEGNTRLRGQVIIEQAQGDIYMGIYE